MLEQAGPVSGQLLSFLSPNASSGPTKGSGSTNNNTLALDLLGEIDLVSGGVFDQDVKVRNGVALLDESRSGVVEESALGESAGERGSDTTSSEHFVDY